MRRKVGKGRGNENDSCSAKAVPAEIVPACFAKNGSPRPVWFRLPSYMTFFEAKYRIPQRKLS
jgi:hypothetical protein